MAFDIYGNDLRRGYCEVHPHVQQEYPCDLCYRDIERENSRQAMVETNRKAYHNHLEQQELMAQVETVRVVVDFFVKRIPKTELESGSIDIDFGEYMIQIQNKDNLKWVVTNAMNIGGYNCREQFENCEVIFLTN